MIKRRRTRQVKVGGVRIGEDAPISIQSMTTPRTANVKATVAQIKRLEAAGCEIVRVAIKDSDDAFAVKAIKDKAKIPVVCDIHFDYTLALACIKAGADKIRLNPGNIRKREEIAAVVRAASRARIPIRVGVNSGSAGAGSPDALVSAAKRYIKILEELDFHDIIVSLKASDVISTVESYRKISGACDYPLHLGVTAAGPHEAGIIKSSIGIGALLLDGIGDTIRVSLTADPVEEVSAAKRILSALNLRNFGPEIISCPTCGRCQVNLLKIVADVERKLSAISYQLSARRPIKIAVMGCEVNGPGEAGEADIGIAAGKGSGVLFINGRIVRRVKESDFAAELLKELKKI
ncbi:MAG: flavodoxin-dependent (E)-4-hydroxy-3-methylbut-2-enyl-diphosphate synthase [Candidatus Omnitrophica bacterium]|nr:flavodoxin-dependent (E)-4-hydroxy-3-methylbut-2-enyl-diphosphate synthase [Candidatus Omnitrophota bacterium]